MEGDLPKVRNSRPLTVEDIDNLYAYGADKEIVENLALIEYESNEDLMYSDYIIGDIRIDGIDYRIVHGFPGDNPEGVIFNKYVTYVIGEGVGKADGNKPLAWYRQITDKCCSYEDNFWYPNKK